MDYLIIALKDQLVNISVNLRSRHLIGGQGDDTLNPGITDVLYPAAHN